MRNATYNRPQTSPTERRTVRGRQLTTDDRSGFTQPQFSPWKTGAGFTIIEMVVYVGILALILAGVVNVTLSVSSTFSELRATRQLNRSAAVLLDRFVREVRDARSVVVGSSAFDAHPGELTLDYGAGVPQVRFYLDGGVVTLDRGGASEGDLTAPGVSATTFIFRRIESGSVSEAVRLEVTLESTSGEGFAAETFYATAVVRGGYGL